jgi:tetratricopeptide (TPR) repeat protein
MGSYFLDDASEESLNKAREYLNSAVEKDPEWAPLYTGLTTVWLSIAQMGYESPEITGPNIFENLNKALELDPDLADSHFISAMNAFLNEWNWDKSESEFLKALATNPNDAMTRVFYAHLLSIFQRYDEALIQGQLALDLDPLNPLIQGLYAALYQCVGDCETAMVYYEKILANDPEHALANDNIADAAYQCGEYERGWEAEKLFYIQNSIIDKDEITKIEEIFYNQDFIAAYEEMVRYLEGLAESGNVGPVNMLGPGTMAFMCYLTNQDDKAIKWLEKGFEMHHPIMPYLFTGFWDWSRLYVNPRFIKIAEKMNLPLPNN